MTDGKKWPCKEIPYEKEFIFQTKFGGVSKPGGHFFPNKITISVTRADLETIAHACITTLFERTNGARFSLEGTLTKVEMDYDKD